MKHTTSTWRRATIAFALGAMTFGAALPAAAAPPAHAPAGRDGGVASVTGIDARADGIARAGAVNKFAPIADDGGFTTQGISWK